MVASKRGAPVRRKARASLRIAVAADVTAANPMGTDGFEFVEYTAPDDFRRSICDGSSC